MSTTRDRIRTKIERDPGIHFNGLVRELTCATGQVQYHLARLCGADDVVKHEYNGRTHYFPPTFDEWERDAIAMLRRETAAAVVSAIYTAETIGPGELSDRLDVPRSTLEHHLSNLERCELVERQRVSGNRVVVELVNPEATRRLLDVVEIDPKHRLVDRFERLVDSLVDDGGDS